VRAHTRATARLARFLDQIEHADLGALTDRAIYNDAAAQGLSIFDLSGKRAEQLREDWASLLHYVDHAG
jgi:chromosome partitioning protein